jgi:hypothetical protein
LATDIGAQPLRLVRQTENDQMADESTQEVGDFS